MRCFPERSKVPSGLWFCLQAGIECRFAGVELGLQTKGRSLLLSLIRHHLKCTSSYYPVRSMAARPAQIPPRPSGNANPLSAPWDLLECGPAS